jgi:hypothetical protein
MIVETDGGWSSMLLPFLILVGIGIVGVVVWLVWMLNRSKAPKPEIGTRAPPPVPQVEGDVPLLVVRRSNFGNWELYVSGQRVRRMAAITNPEEREAFVSALRFLFTFAKGGASSDESASPSPDLDTSQSGRLGAAGAAEPPSPTPRVPVAERRERYSRASSPEGAALTVNLVQEIGDILEEMIAASPEMTGHSIGLINAPTGGIGFAVDGKVYHDLREIPNQEIRALIRKATQEWERR